MWVPRLVIEIAHHGQIQEHGGLPGLRDANALEAALARPQQKWTYDPEADLALLAAAHAFGIATSHPFNDGNKRTAHVCYRVFIALNDAGLAASDEEKYLAMLQLADGSLDEAGFAQWLRTRIVTTPAGKVQEPAAGYR